MGVAFDNDAYIDRAVGHFFQLTQRPWEQAASPLRLAPHVYYVGGSWVGTTLIDTGDGLVLIDTGMPSQLYQIFEGIRILGFDPRQIKKVLISHGHYDHVGAAKAVIEYTGARLYGAREDLAAFEGRSPEDLHNRSEYYTGVTPDEFYSDDRPVIQGNMVIRTKLTAGHTPGTTSFFFEDKGADGRVIRLGLHGGLGPNTLAGQDEKAYAARMIYRRNIMEMIDWPIDVVCSNHPAMADLYERAARNADSEEPFYDPQVWPKMLKRYLAMLDDLEAKETK